MKKRVLFLLQYDDLGSSSKYRILLYKDKFDNDFKTRYSYFWSNKYVSRYMTNKKKYALLIIFEFVVNTIKRFFLLLSAKGKYDVIVIQRCLFVGLRPFFLKRLRKNGTKIIFDIDDALHLDRKYFTDRIASLSECVFAGNEQLLAHYSPITKTILIPTVDNDALYTPFIKDTFQTKCIGWIGSHSTINNLDIVVEPLNKLISFHPEVSFKVISDCSSGYEKKIKNFHFSAWGKDTYLKEMSEFTIGIMPLKDTPFNRGKCGFKLIQYLDLNKPVIASNVGENAKIVSNYGIVIRDDSEWFCLMEKVLFDKHYYDKIIANIKKSFYEKYGFNGNYDKMYFWLSKN